MKTAALFAKSASAGKKLRLGLLFPRGNLPPPARDILDFLSGCEFAEVVAAIVAPQPPPASRKNGGILYRLYRHADALCHRRFSAMLAPRSCVERMIQLPLYAVDADASGSKLVMSDAQRAIFASCKLDVILAIGATADFTELADMARYGVWRCKLGDSLLGDDEPGIFSDTFHNRTPITVSIQAHLRDAPAPIALGSGCMSLLTSVSTITNLVGPMQMGASLVVGKLRQLHTAGWDFLLAQAAKETARNGLRKTTPTDSQMLWWGVTKPIHLSSRRMKFLNTQAIWTVALRQSLPIDGLAAASSGERYTRLDAPEGHYYADPFLMSDAGKTYLFMEQFDIAAEKGSVVCGEVRADNTVGPVTQVLQQPYHLSYPQVIREGSEFYLIPESGFNDTVEIYRATRFPYEWNLQKVLFKGPAFDATLLRHAGLYWFFVTMMDVEYPQSVQLMLFYADSLMGDWTLHPASPISSDIRVARCAGAPFMDNGQWIRPAQDGTETYGGAVRYQRITELDRHQYAEEPAGSLTSQTVPGSIGVHTYNRDGLIEVIDFKTRISTTRKKQASERESA